MESKSKSSKEKVIDPDIDYSNKKSVHRINSTWFIFGLFFVIFTVKISSKILFHVPELSDKDLPFIGAEAWKDLKVLNDIGPKVTGTHENEVLAVNFLKKRIAEIQAKANLNQKVTLDHQLASGGYFLGFKPYGMTSLYRKIQNIVVKLDGSESSNALMLNCHFDSVPGSPGTSDDCANCAIMLEILSILSSRDTRTRHTIIFVFNGAEETGLRASHGFITQQKWAKQVKAFVNLEAAGSGGKETLFQSGPGNTWMLNHYKNVLRPFAQCSGEEIFQSGLIPSDTDFRIFRDFGNLSGLDFAHATRGYRYHTKFDSIDYLTRGVLQRTGENVLELVQSIANSNELDDISEFSKDESAVYFDFLGAFFIHYPKEIGVVVNFIVVVIAITFPFLTLTKATVNVHSRNILAETLVGFVSVVFGSGFSGLICYIIAFSIDKADHSMSWFRNMALAPGIYATAALFSHVVVADLVEMTLASKKSPISLGLKVQARLNGVVVFWGIITLGVTVIGFRVGYLFMLMLLMNLGVNLVTFALGFHNSVHKWIYVHLFGQFFVILWTSYFYNIMTELLIPITGRSGSARNPDILISILCCAMTLLITSFLIPLCQLLKSSVTKYLTLISIFLVSIFLATSTSFGFPYQNEATGNPAVQRHYVVHTTRNFFDYNGDVRLADSGFYFMQWDRHGSKTIEGVSIPDIPLKLAEMCNDEVLCGLPIISSRTLLLGGEWLPSSSPKFPDIAIIDSKSKEILSQNRVKYSLVVKDPSLTSIFIRLRDSVELLSWTFTEEIPQTFNKTYVVSVANGIETEPLNFDLVLATNGKTEEALMDVTLVSLKFDRKQDYTVDFKKILNRFPDWSFAIDAIGSVTSYVL